MDPSRDGEFVRRLHRGSDHLAAGDVEAALAEMEAAVALRPKDAKARGLLALCCFKLGMLERAEATYLELAKENPFDVTLHVNLGLVQIKSGKHEAAVRTLEVATGLAPEHRRAQNYLGLAYAQSGNYEKAREAFIQAGSAAKAREMERALAALWSQNDPPAPRKVPTEPFMQRPPLDAAPEGAVQAESEARAASPGQNAPREVEAAAAEPGAPGEAAAAGGGAGATSRAAPREAPQAEGGAAAAEPSPSAEVGATGGAQAPGAGPSPAGRSDEDLGLPPADGEAAQPTAAGAGTSSELHQASGEASAEEAAFGESGAEVLSMAELTRASRLFWPRGAPFAIDGAVCSIDFSDRIHTRVDGLIAARGDTRWERLHKRFGGRWIDRPFGSGTKQMWLASGGGQLLIAAQHEGVERVFTSVRLEEDAYVVEDRLYAFEEGVDAENGRVPGDGLDLPLVRLRGEGHVLLVTTRSLRSEPIFGNESLRVPLAGLVGWSGPLTPRLISMSPGTEGAWVELTGEGDVLLLS